MIDLSIIILSYKSKEHLSVLLPSIYDSKGVDFAVSSPYEERSGEVAKKPQPLSGSPLKKGEYTAEIIVVDNGSNDGTAEYVENWRAHHPELKLIRNVNNGFAAGNNLGIKQSNGRYILLLNPDTKVEPNTFGVMIEFMDSRPDVGIAGCKLVKGDGTLDLACRRRFPNPWNSFSRLFLGNRDNYNYLDVPEDQEHEVDSVVGAFLMIRREVIEKIGLLDDTFFMYGEDLDWCWRCKEAGFKVWYYPKTFIHHYKGESSKKVPFKALRWFYDAMWIFYRKHYWNKYPFMLHPFVWLGIYGRFTALAVINLFKKNPRVSK